jgi:hypothetical protein
LVSKLWIFSIAECSNGKQSSPRLFRGKELQAILAEQSNYFTVELLYDAQAAIPVAVHRNCTDADPERKEG